MVIFNVLKFVTWTQFELTGLKLSGHTYNHRLLFSTFVHQNPGHTNWGGGGEGVEHRWPKLLMRRVIISFLKKCLCERDLVTGDMSRFDPN